MQKFIGTKRVNATPMTLGAYNNFRNWSLPENEDADTEGYLIEYVDGGKPNTSQYKGYVSWSPKDVFEASYQEQPDIVSMSAEDIVTEDMIKAKGLNARRVSLENLHSAISSVDIIRHSNPAGNVLRFAVLNLDNGFSVSGRPSVSVSPENDDNEVGVKIAVQNAVFELWPFLGFRIVEERK